jgi:hypothetical protein
MRTALPIPAFARGRSSARTAPPGRQIPYHFAIGKTAADRLNWLLAAHPDARIALVGLTTIPPTPAWRDIGT